MIRIENVDDVNRRYAIRCIIMAIISTIFVILVISKAMEIKKEIAMEKEMEAIKVEILFHGGLK